MTTLTDDFNRANGAIGNSAEGWSWGSQQNTHSISGNAAIPGTAGHTINRAESDLGSSDHYSQAVLTFAGAADDVGVTARNSSSANTCYVYLNNGGEDRIYKVVTGTYTSLALAAKAEPSGIAYRLTVTGDALAGTRDGAASVSVTDSSITTGVRCGIRSFNSGGTFPSIDNFEASDGLGAATTKRYTLTTLGVG